VPSKSFSTKLSAVPGKVQENDLPRARGREFLKTKKAYDKQKVNFYDNLLLPAA